MINMNSTLNNSVKKGLISILLVIASIISFIPGQASANEVFSDVEPSNSHYKGILEAYDNGFLSGYPDGSFKPALTLSRANVTKSLGKLVLIKSGVRLEDYNFSNTRPFNDVPASHLDKELYQYSIIVKEAGIFTGSNNNLLPMNLMTRQQMSKVLVNAFKLKHVPGQPSKVIDNDLAGEEFRDYIDILSKNNVTTVTNFRPGETTTRAQFATFLTNANNVAQGNMPIPPEKEPEKDPIPEPVVAMYVKDLLPISFSEILAARPLPTSVPVIYSNGTEKDHVVTWDKNSADLKVGTHHLIGTVKDTNFKANLTVYIYKFVLLPGIPGFPSVPIVPVPPNAPNEYKDANNLMVGLPEAVKSADNALDASQKWALANNAVSIVKDKYPQYDLSTWNKTLDTQMKLIEKRHLDTTNARSAVTMALYNLHTQIKYVKDPKIAQAHINNAKADINIYKALDKKADTTKMMQDINKYQVIIDDLKIVLAAINQNNTSLEIPNTSAIRPGYVLISPQDHRVETIWFFAEGDQYIDFKKKQLIRDTSFFGSLRNVVFIASISKGSANASKKYTVLLESTSGKFYWNGLLVWEDDIIIEIDL